MNSQDTSAEIQSLAEQLAEQVQYTNELLMQLQEHEKQQLALQRDSQSKQIALRQAMSVCDSIRADQAELRRKLSVSQELASRATADAKRWKVECDVKTKEAEGLQKFVEESRDRIDHLKYTLDQKEKAYAELQDENARLGEQMQQSVRDENSRIGKYNDDFEELSRELAELKAVHTPMKTELHVFRAKSEELERTLKARDAEMKRLQDDLDRARRRAAQLEENERQMHLLEAQFKSDLHNEQSRAERTQQQVEAAQSLTDAKQRELDQARKELQELSQSNRALQDEIRSLNSELETVGNDLMGQARKHGLLKEQLEGKIHELQSELAALASESRDRERKAAETVRSRTDDFQKQRKSGELQYAQLQNEHRKLHDLLQRTQNELERQMQQHQAEKEEMESRVGTMQERIRNAEADLAHRDADAKREAGMLLSEIQRLQNQLSTRSGNQVEALGMLSSTIIQLGSECKELLENYNAAVGEIENLKADIENHKRLGAAAVQDWHADTKRALADLAEANNQSRMALDSMRENLLSAEVQRDEERAKNLLLEEEKTRLDDEVQYLKNHVRNLEQASKERLDNARLEYESIATEQTDLAKKVQNLNQQVDELQAQNRNLSQERQRAAQALADAQARSGQRIAKLEDTVSNLEQKLRKTVTERDSFEADRELLKRSLHDATETNKTLQSQIGQLDAQNKDLSERGEKSVNNQSQLITSLRENVRKYQQQLQSTKNLLKVTQEQRKHLQEDNLNLRAELDDIFRRSLAEQSSGADGRSQQQQYLGNAPSFQQPSSIPGSPMSKASLAAEIKSEDRIPTNDISSEPQFFGQPSPLSKSQINGKSPAKQEMHHHYYHDEARPDEPVKPESKSTPTTGKTPASNNNANPLELDLDMLRREVEQLEKDTDN